MRELFKAGGRQEVSSGPLLPSTIVESLCAGPDLDISFCPIAQGWLSPWIVYFILPSRQSVGSVSWERMHLVASCL